MDVKQPLQDEAWRSHLYFQAPLRKCNGDIRLLTIQSRKYAASMPEPSSKSIHCILRLANLKHDPKFTAISHEWEESDAIDEEKSVLVNGVPVPVTTGVFNVLEHAQKEADPTTIWIKAICINHVDVQEKSAQIAQIAEIYGTAARTLVWLGPAAEGSDDAMDVLRRIGEEQLSLNSLVAHWTPQVGHQVWRGIMSKGFSEPPPEVRGEAPSASTHTDFKAQLDTVQPALRSLMEREYWSRLWSIEEISLSAKGIVSCGNRRLPLDTFCAVAKSLDTIINESTVSKWLASAKTPTSPNRPVNLSTSEPSNFAQSPALKVLAQRDFYRRDIDSWVRTPNLPLLSILHRFYVPGSDGHLPLHVADARDRVYALLGLASDATTLGISPDYSKEYRQVLVDISAALLRKTPRPLQLCSGTASTESGYPSWVVDWTSLKAPLSDAVAGDRPFQACGPADERFYRVDSGNPNQISIKGTIVDSVKSIGASYQAHETGQLEQVRSYLSEITKFWEESTGSPSSPYSSQQTIVALAKIPVADVEVNPGHRDQTRRAATVTLDGYQSLLAALSAEKPDTGEERPGEEPASEHLNRATDYLAAMSKMEGWKPFLTETGYVGLGSAGLGIEDDIAIPYGSPVPLALRRQEDDTYRLVGEVYIFGIMDGEFMKVHTKETLLRLS
ncbi:heterokaryon incompatibility protein-domain-containing protein [Biscogniauxia mediterranea]|nr:heterokaryon incompatibility protein-domain-containing protein [Biscogniauxia mediterranea]